jgi:hypothetical protein
MGVIRKGPDGDTEARPGLLALCDDGESRTGSVAAGAVVEVIEIMFA